MPAYFIFPLFTSFSEYDVKMTQAVSADTRCLSSNASQIYARPARGDTKITVVPAQTERESDSSALAESSLPAPWIRLSKLHPSGFSLFSLPPESSPCLQSFYFWLLVSHFYFQWVRTGPLVTYEHQVEKKHQRDRVPQATRLSLSIHCAIKRIAVLRLTARHEDGMYPLEA